MKALAKADGRKRPKRIAKKIASRAGYLHYAGWSEAQRRMFGEQLKGLKAAIDEMFVRVAGLGVLDEFKVMLEAVAGAVKEDSDGH